MNSFHDLNPKQVYRWAFLLVLAHLILWTIPALLWRTSLPLDTTEAFAYSLQWQWGYERDPYLVTLMVLLARFLRDNQPWILYFFSQIAVLAAFAAVWRLARVIGFSNRYALASVLCLEGITYYHFSTPEFNDNVLILPFWTWACFAFYQACQTRRLRYWIGLGIFAGLAAMAKHTGGLLVLSMLSYLLLTRSGRLQWLKPGVYIGALIAFLIILPNLVWLIQHDFATLLWAAKRASLSPHYQLLHHILNPLLFIGAQFLVSLPALLLLAVLCCKHGKHRDLHPHVILTRDQWTCLLSITVLPFLLMLFCSIVTGGELLMHWGTPLFSLIGIVILAAWRPQIDKRRWQLFIAGLVLIFSVFLLSDVIELLWMPRFHHNLRAVFPGAFIAAKAAALWHERFPDRPLRYVDGDRWVSGNISVFASEHPLALPYFFWNLPKPGNNLKITKEQIRTGGLMIVWISRAPETPPTIPYSGKVIFLGYIPFKYQRAMQSEPDYIGVAALPPQFMKGENP